MSAVSTRELRRVYAGRDKRPEVAALDGLTLDIGEGEVFGLLGPNGGGKTTLVKVPVSAILLSSGRVAAVLANGSIELPR